MIAASYDYSLFDRQLDIETFSVLDANETEHLYAPIVLRVIAILMVKYADDDVVQEEGSRYRICMATVLENASPSPSIKNNLPPVPPGPCLQPTKAL